MPMPLLPTPQPQPDRPGKREAISATPPPNLRTAESGSDSNNKTMKRKPTHTGYYWCGLLFSVRNLQNTGFPDTAVHPGRTVIPAGRTEIQLAMQGFSIPAARDHFSPLSAHNWRQLRRDGPQAKHFPAQGQENSETEGEKDDEREQGIAHRARDLRD